MPRQVETPAPRNLTPDSQGQIDVGLPVTAPLLVQQPRTSAQNLSDALDAFMPVVKTAAGKWEESNASQAAEDAASHNQDKWLFKNSPAYHQTFLGETMKARLVLYQAHLQDEVQQFLGSNPTATPEDVNKLVSQRFKEFIYGADGKPLPGMDEASVVRDITPRLAQLRSALVSNAAQQITAQQHQNFEAAWAINIKNELATTGKVDFAARMSALKTAVGGPEANKALLQTIDALQSEYPSADLIGALPDKWADGTPTIKNIPVYATALADIQQRSLRNAVWLQDKVRQQYAENFQSAALQETMAGRSAVPLAQAYMATPGADGQMVQTVLAFQHAYQDNQADGVTDRNTFATLRLQALSSPTDQTLPMRAQQAFLSGELSRADFSGILSDIATNRERFKNNPIFSTEGYKRAQDILKAAYAPDTLLPTPDQRMQQAVAQSLLAAEVESGKSVPDAMTAVQKAIPVLNAQVDSDSLIVNQYGFHTGDTEAQATQQAAAIKSAAAQFTAGKVSAAAFSAQLGALAQHPEMLDKLPLSTEDKAAILKALRASMGGKP